MSLESKIHFVDDFARWEAARAVEEAIRITTPPKVTPLEMLC